MKKETIGASIRETVKLVSRNKVDSLVTAWAAYLTIERLFVLVQNGVNVGNLISVLLGPALIVMSGRSISRSESERRK